MSRTLLDMTQEILSEMDSDEVNSIDDTVESLQVANIIKSTYMAMMSSRDWPHLKKLGQMTNSGSTEHPTHLKVPSLVKEVLFINYNCYENGSTKNNYRQLKWLENDAFLMKQNALNTDADNVEVKTDLSGVSIAVRNDKNPEYYTSFNDDYIVCDSYNSSLENTLVGSKTQLCAYYMPTFSLTDMFEPDLPEEAYTALVENAKSSAMLKLKQTADQKAESTYQKQNSWLSRKAWRVNGGIKYPNYGRRGKK